MRWRAGVLQRLSGAAFLAFSGLSSAAAQSPALPPYQGVYEPQGVDERGLWMEADEYERRIRDSNLLVRDATLTNYVHGVLCRTVGQDRCRNVRTYIMRVPAFNATMSPNGMLMVWSGLLVRCRSEAELASVLGHEFGHFERRHSLGRFRRGRATRDAAAWLAVLGAIATVPTNLDLLLWGAYSSFTRDNEREADILGLAYLNRSVYRPLAASEIWVRMMDEADASALGRAQRSHRYDRVAFFASHPTDLERALYLRRLAGPEVPGRDDGAESYAAAMRPWFSIFLDDQIRLNDFGGAEYLLSQLAQNGWTADLLYARGELYRMRGNPRDLVNAADFYRQAIALDANRAEAFRGLGLALLRAQVAEEGRQALTRYLALKPDATDAPMIRMLAGQGS
jgi:beta-barrel assembly-enhancing protease